jgi:hypothetical protein
MGEKLGKSSGFLTCTNGSKEGRENVENDERTGRSRSQGTTKMLKSAQSGAHSDTRLSIRTTAVQLNLEK